MFFKLPRAGGAGQVVKGGGWDRVDDVPTRY